jgi:hypothetical protein
VGKPKKGEKKLTFPHLSVEPHFCSPHRVRTKSAICRKKKVQLFKYRSSKIGKRSFCSPKLEVEPPLAGFFAYSSCALALVVSVLNLLSLSLYGNALFLPIPGSKERSAFALFLPITRFLVCLIYP